MGRRGTIFNYVVRTHLPKEGTSDPAAGVIRKSLCKTGRALGEARPRGEAGLTSARESWRVSVESRQRQVMESPLDFFTL